MSTRGSFYYQLCTLLYLTVPIILIYSHYNLPIQPVADSLVTPSFYLSTQDTDLTIVDSDNISLQLFYHNPRQIYGSRSRASRDITNLLHAIDHHKVSECGPNGHIQIIHLIPDICPCNSGLIQVW